jgi:hypothetical protein
VKDGKDNARSDIGSKLRGIDPSVYGQHVHEFNPGAGKPERLAALVHELLHAAQQMPPGARDPEFFARSAQRIRVQAAEAKATGLFDARRVMAELAMLIDILSSVSGLHRALASLRRAAADLGDLSEAGAVRRGIAAPPRDVLERQRSADVGVDVYIDTDDKAVASEVFAAVDALAQVVGLGKPTVIELLRGSFLRRSKAAIQSALTEDAVQQRLKSLERAVELRLLDSRQAEADQRTGDALARVIHSLQNVPRTCIRFGSLLIVKYPDASGDSVLLARQLSEPEIWLFENYPELQTHPEKILDQLSMAALRAGNTSSVGDGPAVTEASG